MDIEELANSPVMKRTVQDQLKGIHEEANRELDKTTYEELFEDFAGLFPTEDFEKNGIKSKRNFNGAFYEFSTLVDVQAAFDGSDESGWMKQLNPFDVLPDGTKAVVQKGSWPGLPVFEVLRKVGKIDEDSMYGTFNMGLGLVICISEKDLEKTISITGGFKIGAVESGKGIELLQEAK